MINGAILLIDVVLNAERLNLGSGGLLAGKLGVGVELLGAGVAAGVLDVTAGTTGPTICDNSSGTCCGSWVGTTS